MTAVDPVCRTKVNEAHAAAVAEYARRSYYFCRPDCRVEFDRHPEHYVDELDAGAVGGATAPPCPPYGPAGGRSGSPRGGRPS